MSFRPPRNLPVISVFHNASSPPSVKAVSLLRKASTEPYPSAPNPPLSFELSVVERLPTSDQFKTMQRYYGRPMTAFLGAHFAGNEASSGGDDAERVREAAQKNAMALKYPIVVDWDAGKIAVGDMGDVQKILDDRAKSRDSGSGGAGSSGAGSEGGEKKGWFGGLFGGS